MLCSFLQISFEPLIKRIFPRPVRDKIWVETMDSPNTHRAVRPACPAGRYGICRNLVAATNHIAYLSPALKLRSARRHGASCLHSVFYRYVVHPGKAPSAKSLNP